MPKEERPLQAINPATGELFKEFNYISDKELETKVTLAVQTFNRFKTTPIEDRAKWMKAAGDLLENNASEYGKTMTREMGKPIKNSISETKKCAKWCRWFADNGAKLMADEELPVDKETGKRALITYQPMGVLLQIAPFNFPFMQVIRLASVALMAGNCLLIRHSHNTTMCALLLQDVFAKAGFPEGSFQILLSTKDQLSKLIADPRIKGVSLTGSTRSGKHVAKQCGENVKKHVLELGGSDAYIICGDCDLEPTVKDCVQGRIGNAGQSCTAAKRFVVVESIYDQFCQKLVQKMQEVKMGDPMKEDTEMGPLAREDLRNNVHNTVEQALKEGKAKLLCGGKIPDMKGFYYPPTVLEVTPDSIAVKEEIFGPVACVLKARDEQHAIELSNQSMYGLGGGVFTKDEKKGEKIARELECGMAFVNRIVTSNPQYPFGGVKDSGYGKECGVQGFREWVIIKTLIIK